MLRIAHEALTFDDVLLLPAHSRILPSETDLRTRLTRNIGVNIPLMSSAMDTVTESRLAIAMAQEGGIGVVHKNMSIDVQAREVRAVKKYETGVIRDPITIEPGRTVAELLVLTRENRISGVPVVERGKLVGIVTARDVRFEKRLDARVREVMTPRERLVTASEDASFDTVTKLLHEHRIEKVLLVNEGFELKGMVTVKDIHKAQAFPNACKDSQGQLRVGASVGTSPDTDERVAALIEAGADVVVVDTAHGHAKSVLDRVSLIKQSYPDMQVIGGNVATEAGAKAMLAAGADAIKVGIGPGSICTTRVVTGIGVPQITAVAEAVSAANEVDVPVIADGGIRYSGDIAKAIAAGASVVMIGGLLAGTDEAPGERGAVPGSNLQVVPGHGFGGCHEGAIRFQRPLFPGGARGRPQAGAGRHRGPRSLSRPRRPHRSPVDRRPAGLHGLHGLTGPGNHAHPAGTHPGNRCQHDGEPRTRRDHHQGSAQLPPELRERPVKSSPQVARAAILVLAVSPSPGRVRRSLWPGFSRKDGILCVGA